MNTFIMMWNPAISNWKMEDFELTLCHFDDVEFKWAIYDYKKAKEGDRFFLVRCGEGNTGIVMSGTFSSKPYKGEDWSGKGRDVYYVNMDLGAMIHPNKEDILTTEELEKAIPGFEWNGGHSGRLLDTMSAGRLELIWQAYINGHKSMFESGMARLEVWIENGPKDNLKDYLKKKHGETCECCGFNFKEFFGKQCKKTIDYVYLYEKDYENADELEKSYHALCSNCRRIINTIEDLERYKK